MSNNEMRSYMNILNERRINDDIVDDEDTDDEDTLTARFFGSLDKALLKYKKISLNNFINNEITLTDEEASQIAKYAFKHSQSNLHRIWRLMIKGFSIIHISGAAGAAIAGGISIPILLAAFTSFILEIGMGVIEFGMSKSEDRDYRKLFDEFLKFTRTKYKYIDGEIVKNKENETPNKEMREIMEAALFTLNDYLPGNEKFSWDTTKLIHEMVRQVNAGEIEAQQALDALIDDGIDEDLAIEILNGYDIY